MKGNDHRTLRIWLPVFLLLIGWGLRLFALDARPLWWDEGLTLVFMRLTPADSVALTIINKDPNPPLYRWAVGGLMESMGETMALLAPNANSFRRFQSDSFVPLAPTWGVNNRTVAIRIPAGDLQSTRLEHRVAGADANPYLVMAAVLAGVHRGITAKIDPGPPISGNAGDQVERELPSGWLHALEAFEASELMREYLGRPFMDLYAACKRFERASFASHVTSLEYQWYLRTV